MELEIIDRKKELGDIVPLCCSYNYLSYHIIELDEDETVEVDEDGNIIRLSEDEEW